MTGGSGRQVPNWEVLASEDAGEQAQKVLDSCNCNTVRNPELLEGISQLPF